MGKLSKGLLALLGTSAVTEASTTWSKCSQPCGGGTQTNADGDKRKCNIESCDILTNNYQLDSGMDLTLFENLTAAWKGVSGAVATQIDDGYFGKAWRTTNRAQKWHTLVQDQPCSVFTEGEEVFSKAFVRFPNGAHDSFQAKIQLKYQGINGNDFAAKYLNIGVQTVIPAEDGTDPKWFEIGGMETWPSYEGMNPDDLQCRMQVIIQDKTINFDTDQFITAPVSTIQSSLPQHGMVRNGDLEIPVDSALFSVATGQGGSGFSMINQGDTPGTIETLYSKEAPEGDAYLKWSPGSTSDFLVQHLAIDDSFDPEQLMEIRYWAKFTFKDGSTTTTGEENHFSPKSQLQMTHEPNSDGVEETFSFQIKHAACFIPDGQWRQYHATLHIGLMFAGEDWVSASVPDRKRRNTEDCFEDCNGIGKVNTVKWRFFMDDTPYNTYETTNVDFHLDGLWIDYYQRDRTWEDGANERIKELRTMPHKINVIDAPAGATLDIEMLNQPYPFGAKFTWDQWEGDAATWTDLQGNVIQTKDTWKYLFNYGYCTNAMKWARTERTFGGENNKQPAADNYLPNGNEPSGLQSQYGDGTDYLWDRADAISDWFLENEIDLSGNTLFWEVENKATPGWFKDAYEDCNPEAGVCKGRWNKETSSHEAPEYTLPDGQTHSTMAPLESYMLNHVRRVAKRYKGKNQSYKIMNECTHGDNYRSNFGGRDIWQRVMNVVSEEDPDALSIQNDYNIGRGDKGQCFLDLTDGYDFDLLGVQCHQHPGFNYQAVYERFDQLSSGDDRLIITEFDTKQWDLTERALDTEDFMRAAYSHPFIDQIITWYFMWTEASDANYNDQTLFVANATGHLESGTADEATPFLHLDQGIYPMYPNEAGVKWIDVVKREWNSTELEIDVGATDQRITQNLERDLFAADYRIVVRDADGAVLEEQTMTVEPCSQDVVKDNNMVLDGEFDHLMSRNTGKLLPRNQGLTSEWDIGQSEYEIHFDGYMRDGLLIKDFQSATVSPAGGLVDGNMYMIYMFAKPMCQTCTYTGSEVLNIKDASGNIVASGNLKSFNRFSRIETKDIPFIPSGDNSLTIEVENYSGDLMIDHLVIGDLAVFQSCQKEITFNFATCENGFEVDNTGACIDIDECTTGAHNCDEHATCINSGGSFSCSCNTGFFGISGTVGSCGDLDECLTSWNDCPETAECSNTVGSYECDCGTGFELNSFVGVQTCDNINECTAGTADCDDNADCTDTEGSFTCACQNGYDGDGKSCSDIDECAAATPVCHDQATCANTDGGFSCSCNGGFDGDGLAGRTATGCVDIDECMDADACTANSNCENLDGSFACSCKAGFGRCTNLNECELGTDTCNENAVCDDIEGSYTCTCDPGYEGVGKDQAGGIIPGCTDVDECANETDTCHSKATCTNIDGGFTCACNGDGYTGNGIKKNQGGTGCDDINECDSDNGGCHENAKCSNTDGSFTCACKNGFTGDGIDCSDINECDDATLNNCHESATCSNNDGGFECTCNAPGWVGDGVTCSDLDECDIGSDTCDPNATCVNNPGSFDCECNAGFTAGADDVCADVNECDDATLNDCDVNASCSNSPGTFSCQCNSGYTGTGIECTDIDECSDATLNNCDANGTCDNNNGGFTCACDTGYLGDGSAGKCFNENECATGNNDCGDNTECVDTDGSFSCSCLDGFEQSAADSKSCVDIDECTLETDNCHKFADCTNNDGGFECTCIDGYSGNGVKVNQGGTGCADVDECLLGTAECFDNSFCKNTEGSYKCKCNNGWELNGDSTACLDVNECDTGAILPNTCNEFSTCVNNDGSYECDCNEGFGRCADLDECDLGTDECDDKAECKNTLGTYDCECNDGYEGDGRQCVDTNECVTGDHNCDANGICINREGSFMCICPGGWTGDGTQCSDIDECADGTDTCNANAACTNTPGGFTCECNAGYTGDGETCDNVNECESDANNCADLANCIDTIGSFSCSCLDGYTGDGVTCADKDECALNEDGCHPKADCANTDGSFTCTCIAGYAGPGFECSNVDECVSGDNNCDVNADCADTEGSYTCTCPDGFTDKNGDGSKCKDIDECADRELQNCSWKSVCTNTDGGFECTCEREGYTGNGVKWSEGGTGCGDIDECSTGDAECFENSFCKNTDGSYKCKCNDGFVKNDDATACNDVDECTDGTNTCDNNTQECLNSAGGFTCECKAGFGRCADLDECALETHDCDANADCENELATFSCECKNGFQGDGKECSDIDECQAGTDNCSTNGICTNTPSSFTCECNPGFVGDGVTCDNIDECAANTHNCVSSKATCTDNDGGFTCECNAGYDGDGVKKSEGGTGCSDIDECATDDHDCDINATCTNDVGAFTCACNSGWTGTGQVCNDINECDKADDNNCADIGVCVNTPGLFTCTCPAGYTGDGTVCDNNDECTDGTNNCHTDATCTDTEGSFDCNCNDGFEGDGVTTCDSTIVLVDECTLGTHDCDLLTTVCEDLTQGFTCACKTNYVVDANGNCIFDQSICADKLANADWKGMNAASTQRPAATRFSGYRTGPSGSPAIHSASVKMTQWRQPETTQYTGFIIFPKSECSTDFMKALGDGRIKFDMLDIKSQYTPQFTYFRDDGSKSSLTIQYSSNQDLQAGNNGNEKVDTAWLEMTGISQVSWGESGTKDIRKCVRAAVVGSMPEITDEDLSGCAGEAQTIG